MKQLPSKQVTINAGDGVEFVTHKKADAVHIDVRLLKVSNKARQLTLNDRELKRILRKAEKIHSEGDPNVKLNLEWIGIIRRLVNQARL